MTTRKQVEDKFLEALTKVDWNKLRTQITGKYHQSDRLFEFLKANTLASLDRPVPTGFLLYGAGGYGKSAITKEFFRLVSADLLNLWGSGAAMQFTPDMSEASLYGGMLIPTPGEVIRFNLQGSFLTGGFVICEEVFSAPSGVLLSLREALANPDRVICFEGQCIPVNLQLYALNTNVSPEDFVADLQQYQPSAVEGAQAFIQRFAGMKVEWESHTARDYAIALSAFHQKAHREQMLIFTEALEFCAQKGVKVSPREAVQQLWPLFLQQGDTCFQYSNTLQRNLNVLNELTGALTGKRAEAAKLLILSDAVEQLALFTKKYVSAEKLKNDPTTLVGALRWFGELKAKVEPVEASYRGDNTVYQKREMVLTTIEREVRVVLTKLQKQGELASKNFV